MKGFVEGFGVWGGGLGGGSIFPKISSLGLQGRPGSCGQFMSGLQASGSDSGSNFPFDSREKRKKKNQRPALQSQWAAWRREDVLQRPVGAVFFGLVAALLRSCDRALVGKLLPQRLVHLKH